MIMMKDSIAHARLHVLEGASCERIGPRRHLLNPSISHTTNEHKQRRMHTVDLRIRILKVNNILVVIERYLFCMLFLCLSGVDPALVVMPLQTPSGFETPAE